MFATAVLEAMLTRLARLFLGSAGNDEQTARQAAHHALLAYRPRSDSELMLAAEIVSFSLHALDALNRSMDTDLSVNQICRLRSNAVSLSREAHKAQRKLDQLQKIEPLVEASPPEKQVDTSPQATQSSRPAGQTWTQAYHQRQRDKRLADRAQKITARTSTASSGISLNTIAAANGSD
jgi:hypothetical protein